MTDSVRLNKRLALILGISRREADLLIEKGAVTIDGKLAQLGAHTTNDSLITVDGAPIGEQPSYQYIILHKPVGYVCSRRAQGDNPTIYELLPQKLHTLKPVGRLDKDSSGILLLTNDGDFAHTMTHPSFRKIKLYTVELDHALEPLHQQMISDFGIEIGDGTSKLGLEKLNDTRTEWRITMHEGRNRQIRRTFAALGYEVIALHRTQFGNYSLGDIQPGEFKTTDIHSVI